MTMTNSSFPADAALGPGNPEPDIALGALRRAVLRARGFNLVFAVCNQPVQRDQLIEQLGHGLPEGVRVVHLSSNCTNVLAEVQSHLPPENTVPSFWLAWRRAWAIPPLTIHGLSTSMVAGKRGLA